MNGRHVILTTDGNRSNLVGEGLVPPADEPYDVVVFGLSYYRFERTIQTKGGKEPTFADVYVRARETALVNAFATPAS